MLAQTAQSPSAVTAWVSAPGGASWVYGNNLVPPKHIKEMSVLYLVLEDLGVVLFFEFQSPQPLNGWGC